MNRLHLYFIVDASLSIGIKTQVSNTINRIIEELNYNPHAYETVYASLVEFSSKANPIIPLTELNKFVLHPLSNNKEPISLSAVLEYMMKELDTAKLTPYNKEDLLPVIFLFTRCLSLYKEYNIFKRWDTYRKRCKFVIVDTTDENIPPVSSSFSFICGAVATAWGGPSDRYMPISNDIIHLNQSDTDDYLCFLKNIKETVESANKNTSEDNDDTTTNGENEASKATYTPRCINYNRLKQIENSIAELQKKISKVTKSIHKEIDDIQDKINQETESIKNCSSKTRNRFNFIIGINKRKRTLEEDIDNLDNEHEVTEHNNIIAKLKSTLTNLQDKRKETISNLQNKLNKYMALRDNAIGLSDVYSSVFAPAEVRRKSYLHVQIYFHLYEETDKVKLLARESDKNAERRDYIPLSIKLREGDKIDVEFNIYGVNRLMSERKSVIWQGKFTKCSFQYFVPQDIDIEELNSEANLFVNDVMIGEMRFITKIVETPRNLNPEILSHRFNRIFISYAHQDSQQIEYLALAYKAQGVDYFYDRDSLAPGDIYEEKIYEYIDSSDLFILCWSKNAAASDYVEKEAKRALRRAYPQLSMKDAKLKICPISIEPRADLPSYMKEIYNFEVM